MNKETEKVSVVIIARANHLTTTICVCSTIKINTYPCCSESRWFKRVVFPAPRKPVNTVTGTVII